MEGLGSTRRSWRGRRGSGWTCVQHRPVTRVITAADGPRYIARLTTTLTTPLGQLTVDDSNASASTPASIPSPSAQGSS